MGVSKRKTSSTTQCETSTKTSTKLTDYERERQMRIERNAIRAEELGFAKLANQLMNKARGIQGKRCQTDNRIHLDEEDQEYMPEKNYDDEFTDLEEETTTEDVVLSSKSNKVVKATTRKHAAIGEKNQPLCPAMSIVDFLKRQNRQELAQSVEDRESLQDQEHHMQTLEITSVLEQENQKETNEQAKDPVKRHRGPTMLFDVHGRELGERTPIFFNEHGQPIGPTGKACGEFGMFLGTIAHEHSWAPLTYTSWHKVPDKDRMWEYVNEKYILPQTESVKKWVLESIASAWRLFKCRIKTKHYKKYDNDAERWKHRPVGRMPDSHFKMLMQYWKTSPIKKISAKNSENRERLDNMHTVGPVSFARIHHKLTKEDGQPPSKRKLFEETRKRKEGRKYKKPYDDTLRKIGKMKELEALHEAGLSDGDGDPFDIVMNHEHRGRLQLYGRGVSMKNAKAKEAGTSIIIPEEYAESIRSSLVTEMQKDYDAQKDKLANEFDARFSKLADMKNELEAKEDQMVDNVVAKALVRLRELCPNITGEMLGQVVASSLAE